MQCENRPHGTLILSESVSKSESANVFNIGRYKGVTRDAHPRTLNSFIFMQFSTKKIGLGVVAPSRKSLIRRCLRHDDTRCINFGI